MRISRIYTDQDISIDQTLNLDDMASRHLVQVLRLRPGTEFVLFNGNGCNYKAVLETASKKQVQAHIISCSDPEPESTLSIHLCISVSKGERMDFAIQKSVELGVTEITPLFSKHGVVTLKDERLQKRQQHWGHVMISACEQSGRSRIPKLNKAENIEKWFETEKEGLCLTLDHRAESTLPTLEKPCGKINILIGPEGGLSEAEIIAATSKGFIGIRMGPRILRTETAPLAAISAMQTLWGDFR